MNTLFTPFSIKSLELKNRIVLPPMCQYAVKKQDGIANNWHTVHYASRAVGGTGLIIVEATAINPDGRLTNYDLGLWDDAQIPALAKIVDLVHENGSKIGIQLVHAGRKAEDMAVPLAPSANAYPGYHMPKEMSIDEIKQTIEDFTAATKRAIKAGFDMIEVHGAHGYLIHQFMSEVINTRTDIYGQERELFGKQIVEAVKAEVPSNMPLFMRLSAREYVDGGYNVDYCLNLAQSFYDAGIDVFDISTGGEDEPGKEKPGNFPGYQIPFGAAFKERFNIPVAIAGILDSPAVAESVVGNQLADLVCVGRAMLRDPYWPYRAQFELTGKVSGEPAPYERAFDMHTW